jgi:hypothetical protein
MTANATSRITRITALPLCRSPTGKRRLGPAHATYYFLLTAVAGAPDTLLIPGARPELGCWGGPEAARRVPPGVWGGRRSDRRAGPKKEFPSISTESSIVLPSDLGQTPEEVEGEKKGDPTAHATQTPRRLQRRMMSQSTAGRHSP